MGIHIRNLENSFVRFDETVESLCLWEGVEDLCLPVFEQEDIYFQFLVEADTIAEADALCGLTNDVEVGLVYECADAEFSLAFAEKPQRYRVGLTSVLYNWAHGLPGFSGEVQIGSCFRIRIKIGEDLQACSNCFQRISSPCFTTVVEYGNNENAFGFLYCADASDLVDDDDAGCVPLAISFIDEALLDIPYTTSMQEKYGDVPSVQVWHYIGGVLRVVIVEVTLNGAPPTIIHIDNGGPATGWIVIR